MAGLDPLSPGTERRRAEDDIERRIVDGLLEPDEDRAGERGERADFGLARSGERGEMAAGKPRSYGNREANGAIAPK